MALGMTRLYIFQNMAGRLANFAPEEKNKISHRGKALALIKEELDKSEELYAEDNDSK